MPWDNRETKVVAAVACSLCGAPVGRECRSGVYPDGQPIYAHRERRQAWRIARGPVPPIAPTNPCLRCGHGSGSHTRLGCDRCACPATRDEIRAHLARRRA